jgi:flagellar protein FlaG
MPIDQIAKVAATQVQPVGSKRPVSSPAADGALPRQSLPGSGEVLPVEAVAASPGDVTQAVSRLSDYVQSVRRDLQFRVDEETDRVVVSVVDPESGEVIRQIPAEEVVAVARTLGQMQGLLINTKA